MRKHDLDTGSLLPAGHMVAEVNAAHLHVTTTRRLSIKFDDKNSVLDSYLLLPQPFRLPMRIDLTIRIDAPGFYLLVGNGHLNFGTPWSDNRRIDDIVEPQYKPRFFHHHIPLNEFVDISVVYDLHAMQIIVSGEERYYSTNERYMKSKRLEEMNATGFPVKITCDKGANMFVKAFSVTEYDGRVEIIRSNADLPKPIVSNVAVKPGEKATFENCLSSLPKEIYEEILRTDAFLRSLRPMKFKRLVEKHGNKITYLASEQGFSYTIYPSNDIMHHSLSWYIITGSKPEFWHRKADGMEATLSKLAETSPELAERLFHNLIECIACCECLVKTPYAFNGHKKMTCHGLMEFKMCRSDFEDVRAFIRAANDYHGQS
ncbi:hypothetical protein [Gorillibacterium massiliense]|uniref:hypothetical protein n=1 Tax=Gorillibacterium massiliense TaxID=1280390 RepID=UPI00059395BA|nr:hypothetical protein [Gorillibacterium massiliense]